MHIKNSDVMISLQCNDITEIYGMFNNINGRYIYMLNPINIITNSINLRDIITSEFSADPTGIN